MDYTPILRKSDVSCQESSSTASSLLKEPATEQLDVTEEAEHFDEGQAQFAASTSQSEWETEIEEKSLLLRRATRRGARSVQVGYTMNPRRLPHRESRVKSFKQLLEYPRADEDVRSSLAATEMAPSRIFVSNDVIGMHLDWPLYSQQAESFATAAHIIVSDAALVRTSLICTTVPQEFTEVGTFVVAMSGLQHRHEVTLDGLGSWGTPQGTTKFYNFCSATRKLMIATPESYAYKVQSNRYIHPGTDERGHFIKKIFCGMTNTGEGCAYAVITYSWEGTPHPIAVAMPTSAPSRERPYGSRSWEASDIDVTVDEGVMHHGLPVLSRVAVDFDLACKILLAGVEIPQHRICTQVPSVFRDGGTFVLDIDACGGEKMLSHDGHEWMKPSGSSRYFRFDDDDNITRVDRAGVAPSAEQFDIQVLAKRYECTDVPGFVRKLYIVRDKASEPRVNTHIAVLTYHWKAEPAIARANRGVIITRKRQAEHVNAQDGSRALLESIDAPPYRMKRSMGTDLRIGNDKTSKPKSLPMIDALSRFRLSPTDNFRRLALTKKSENLCRLAAILDRAEPIMERFEQYFLSNCHSHPLNSTNAMWMEQPLSDQLIERGEVAKATSHEMEECVIVNEQGEPIELPPGCEIVYESSS
uniref:Non-specific serine/threonine protein kinase n=1 Tax=Haemonchus contortus TaxID=6289 RepID=A0A7I4YQ68_HAECO